MQFLLLASVVAHSPATTPGGEKPDFARDVKPVLVKHCVSCHGSNKRRGSLRLDSAAGIRKGGSSGPAVVPGKPASSLLLLAVTGGKDDIKPMPPEGPRLAAAEVAKLRAWIAAGAPAPANEVVAAARSKHWSFQPVVRQPAPA